MLWLQHIYIEILDMHLLDIQCRIPAEDGDIGPGECNALADVQQLA